MTAPPNTGRPPDPGDTGDSLTSLFFKRLLREEPVPAPGLAPGKQVGDFRLVRLIGQGGMGQVWEATQRSLGDRRVALKFVRPERVTARQLEYFQREARAGGRLSHPGIVAVYGYGEDAGLAWIAMEFVEGGVTLHESIDELTREDEVPAGYDREVARLVAELADALQAAHDAGVIHRDLKPQNILITPDNRAKVTDFGLARITDETALSQTGKFAGTYYYMSPEQAASKRAGIDHRSDVFSLGVVLYELLALRRPFLGDTSHQVTDQILFKDPPDPRTIRSRIPRELVVIAGKALEKDRDRRYASMAELAADLRRFLSNEPILAQPPTRWDRAVKWARRHPTRTVAGAVVAVAFVAISLLLGENVKANRELDAEVTSVKRLSALQKLEDLITEADDPERMWPPHPERIAAFEAWIERARELVDELPLHRAKREELRASALPRSEEQRRRERAAHPRFAELAALNARITAARRALEQRRDGVATNLPDISAVDVEDDPARLLTRASALLAPEGGEPERAPDALALIQLALELVDEGDSETRSAALLLLSRAAFALGRDDEALDASFEAFELAEGEAKESAGAALAALDEAVTEATSSEGLATAESELAQLESQQAPLDALVDERVEWHFPDEQGEARWWNAQLTKLISGLEALVDERMGLLATSGISAEHGLSVPRRLARARELEVAYAPGAAFDLRWKKALPEIHARYPGLELPIQMGLVPMAPDPASGWWEFLVVLSGEEPERGADGRLVIAEATGIVLVLLPAGRFFMGAQSESPSSLNYDPEARLDEAPVHEVALSAHFLSKFELTQAQWKRLTGSNPSYYSPESLPRTVGWTHPVESVDWRTSRTFLRRLGLDVPSEAQWERAARAGTATPFSCGREELATHANLADQELAETFDGVITPEPWSDGFGDHAPVGSLEANTWGLYDMHGNLYEWCLDEYDSTMFARSGLRDPVAHPANSALRVVRGGSFGSAAVSARCSDRHAYAIGNSTVGLGLRPSRGITP